MPVCGCYLCAADVDNWPSGITEAEQEAIILKVEQWIDKVTGTHWCGEELDIKLNGNDKNRLFIPIETDILTVEHVYVSCIELPESWYTWDANSIYLDPCTSGAGVLDPELSYKLAETVEKGIFPRGYNNIWVQGTMGEFASGEGEEVPELIKQAAVILAQWENDPTLYTLIGDKKSEKIGDYSYTNYSIAELEAMGVVAGGEVLTGIFEADIRLVHYLKRKAILMSP